AVPGTVGGPSRGGDRTRDPRGRERRRERSCGRARAGAHGVGGRDLLLALPRPLAGDDAAPGDPRPDGTCTRAVAAARGRRVRPARLVVVPLPRDSVPHGATTALRTAAAGRCGGPGGHVRGRRA